MLLLALLVGLGAGDPPCPGGTVLDGDALHDVVSVHDILRRAAPIDIVSLDGFDAEPHLAWGAPQPVRLVLDGAPVASTTAIEPLGLSPLPVAVGEIARVVVCPGPGLAAGRWGGPWIEIETARPGRVYAAGAYGNETGDPGPELYTDDGLTNVDRWGPYGDAAVGAPLAGAEVWAAVRGHELFPTDSSLAPRIYQTSPLDVLPLRSAVSAGLALSAPGLGARLGASGARDYPFLPSIVREVPVDRRTVQASLRGQRSAGALAVRAHAHAARLTLTPTDGSRLRVGAGGTGPDWTETCLDGAASAHVERGAFTFAAGVQAERVSVDAEGLSGSGLTTGRAWLSADRAHGVGRETLALQLVAADGGVVLGGVFQGRRALGRADAALTLALDRRPPPPDRIGVWLRRGYSGLDGTFVTPASASDQGETVAVARLDLGLALAPGLRLDVAADGQRARLDVEQIDIVSGGGGAVGTTTVVSAEGTAARLRADARWAAGRWRLSAGGRVQGAVGGDAAFRAAWRRQPRAVAHVRAAVRPDDRLHLWAALRVQSGTSWAGYPAPEVPGAALLDLGIAKNAWGNRLLLSVLGRNVLDAPERTHPLGAVHAPRLFVRAALTL